MTSTLIMIIILLRMMITAAWLHGVTAMKKIKYCKRNMKNGLEPVYKAMKKKYPDIKQKKSDCLGNCKTCKLECFVVVKSKPIAAPSADQLYKRLKKMIG